MEKMEKQIITPVIKKLGKIPHPAKLFPIFQNFKYEPFIDKKYLLNIRKYVEKELNVWENKGLLGQHDRWENFHERLIENTARLVGAQPSEVVVMNALTVNIHLLLISFYQPNENRKKHNNNETKQ